MPLRNFSNSASSVHHSQVASLTDSLIEVDDNDKILGRIPKLEGHLAKAVESNRTHRAFSVFLFSSENHSLLIQKRARTKIVFPNEWANTCCSHPLYVAEEMEVLNGNNIGVKRAASKRLMAELGINALPPLSFAFKGKILYRKLSPGGIYGESELDYILFNQMSENDKSLVVPEPDEVSEIAWIPPGPAGARTFGLKKFIQEQTKLGFPATPWFNLMVQDPECLEHWWSKLIEDASSFLKQESGKDVKSFVGK